MQTGKLAYKLYAIATRLAWTIGIAKPLRRYIGPLAGRLAFKAATDANQPSYIQGHLMFVAVPGRYPPHRMAMDRFEEGTTQVFQRLIEPGMTIIDIGAHVGYFSLIAARAAGTGGLVFAFEPDPDNYSLLKRNIALNGYETIEAVQNAVANKDGQSTLFQSALDNGRHSIVQQGIPEFGQVKVETTSLDIYLEEKGWPRIGLVKVDVEGAEARVLEGMNGLISRSDHLNLILEFNPILLQNAEVDPIDLFVALNNFGFTIQYINERTGTHLLDDGKIDQLIKALVRDESSVNLLCCK